MPPGSPSSQPATYRDPQVLDEFRALAPDLQVMAFVTLVVPEEFLRVPTHGTIQYHPSLLPKHRGRSSINWPIIMGETETGLSIFWPDGGLDTGDVLLQKTTPIGPDDTLGTVYFERLFPMGVAALLEAVDLVKAGTAPRITQDEERATYEGPCERVNARIDWGKPWRQIHDLVRGCDPAPGAWTTYEGADAAGLRDGAAAGPRPRGPRRRPRRGRRGHTRDVHGGLRGRPHLRGARPARRRRQDPGRRVGRERRLGARLAPRRYHRRMTASSPSAFHVMAKPTGARCNLHCDYCFFLEKEALYPGSDFRMSDEVDAGLRRARPSRRSACRT